MFAPHQFVFLFLFWCFAWQVWKLTRTLKIRIRGSLAFEPWCGFYLIQNCFMFAACTDDFFIFVNIDTNTDSKIGQSEGQSFWKGRGASPHLSLVAPPLVFLEKSVIFCLTFSIGQKRWHLGEVPPSPNNFVFFWHFLEEISKCSETVESKTVTELSLGS